jgi:predicted nuclease of predicted toxin-antitoxin system
VFWVDAQLPPALARWLTVEFGEPAAHVMDLGLLDASDVAIFEAPRATEGVVLITKDEDFLRLLEQRHAPPQVVWITCGNVRNSELHRIVTAAWPDVTRHVYAGEPLVEISRRRCRTSVAT